MALTDIIYTTRAKLTALYDAIREKAGVTGTMTIDQATEAVESISVGDERVEKLLRRYNMMHTFPLDLSDYDNVGSYACYEGQYIDALTLKDGATIGHNAFYNCGSITIPSDRLVVSSVGNSAFTGCHSMHVSEIVCTGVLGQTAFNGCTSLDVLKLKVGTMSGASNFSNCSGLTRVWISSICEIVPSAVFWGASAVEIYTDATEKPTKWNNNFAQVGSGVYATVHYGVSEEEFDNLEG